MTSNKTRHIHIFTLIHQKLTHIIHLLIGAI